jgi:lipopolysaccharide transport system ATP-binding protein
VSSHVVSARGLSKDYRIPHLNRSSGHPSADRTSLLDRIRLKLGRHTENARVLNDVSFDVDEGEIVGVIGRNGSGKSTLLKVLSRIIRPTEGHAWIAGHVGALLEVGTGFHPDLTGRENVSLNGTLLGMSAGQIRDRFDEVVAFAEIERFLDLPVKYYSSGMYTRLAFAVAAHLDPEVLIVDEVLSVGDAEFQKKCLGKMGSMTRSGRTVFFVSHNMAAVSELCTRCLLLRSGRLVCDDVPEAAIQHYVESSEAVGGGEIVLPRPNNDPPVYISRAALKNVDGALSSQVEMGDNATLEIDYFIEKPLRDINLEVLLSRNGVPLLNSFDTDAADELRGQRAVGAYRAWLNLPLRYFKEGTYTIEFPIHYGRQTLTDPSAVLPFDLVNYRRDLTHRSYRADRPGQFAVDIPWQTQKLN